MDNLNDAYDRRLKNKRIESIESLAGFNWEQADIADYAVVQSLFSRESFDGVINLAARAGVRQSATDPWEYYNTNVIGTINLLEQCRLSGVDRFVVASSSSVYGNNDIPFSESGRADRPLSPYAASKKAVEDICHAYNNMYGFGTTALRFFTVYGPAGRPDMSVFRFVRAIVEGEEMTVFGDGHQSRDFTYIDDIAAGVVASAETNGGFRVINLGSDHPVELREMISEIEKVAGKGAVIKYEDSDPLDVRKTWADVTVATELLGWKPNVSLATGIQRTVDWYMENRDWARELNL